MKTYIVTMHETVRRDTDITIEASNEKEARALALKYEGIEDEHTYNEELVDFEIGSVKLDGEDDEEIFDKFLEEDGRDGELLDNPFDPDRD